MRRNGQMDSAGERSAGFAAGGCAQDARGGGAGMPERRCGLSLVVSAGMPAPYVMAGITLGRSPDSAIISTFSTDDRRRQPGRRGAGAGQSHFLPEEVRLP